MDQDQGPPPDIGAPAPITIIPRERMRRINWTAFLSSLLRASGTRVLNDFIFASQI